MTNREQREKELQARDLHEALGGEWEIKDIYNLEADRGGDITKGKSLLLPVQIGDIQILAIIDSGAQTTILSSDLANQCIRGEPITSIQLRGISQNVITGEVFQGVEIGIGNQIFTGDVITAPIPEDMLIGADFLFSLGVKMDFGLGRIEINGETIEAKVLIDEEIEEVARARVAGRVKIPPNSSQLVEVSVNKEMESDFVIIPIREAAPCMMPSSLHSSTSKLVVQCINDTNVSIVLEKGLEIGIVEEGVEIQESQMPTDGSQTFAKVRSVKETKLPPHLEELFERSTQELDENEAKKLKALLSSFQDVFSAHDLDIGCFDAVPHRIELTDPTVEPIKERIRRTPRGFEDEEEKHLAKMIEIGVIQPSQSAWASAPVLIRKKDGSVRWCLDYRKLNQLTRKDAFPLPLISDCLDALAENKFMSTLDMASGYWQIQVHPEDRDKTAFITKYGLFEFVRMPFGLTNAPSTFQRAINLVLRGLTWKAVLAFLDDVLVLGSNFEEHLQNLSEVFLRFRQHNLKLKPAKCLLFRTKAKFLGKIVGPNSIEVDPESLKVVADWPVPKNTRDVESFLGFVNYHREHVPNLTEIAVPLYQLTGKAPFRWEKEQQEAFEKIKELLVSPVVLALPQKEGMFILDTDASNEAIGGCLSQDQEGTVRPLSFSGKRLTPAQRKYCTTRKELLAVITFTRQYRHYLLGRKFLVRTDHNSLTWLMRFKDAEGQLARWLEELAQFDIQILHRKGSQHTNADALSRVPDNLTHCDCYRAGQDLKCLPCGGCPYCTRATEQWKQFEEDVDDVVPLAVTTHINLVTTPSSSSNWEDLSNTDWAEDQNNDKDLKLVKSWVENNTRVSREEWYNKSPSVKKLWGVREQLLVQDGVLKYDWVGDHPLVVVPKQLREVVMKLGHDNILAGHFGMDKTYQKIKAKFFWPGMRTDIDTFVQSCNLCNKSKHLPRRHVAPLVEFSAGAPMQKCHMDILGPLPKTKRGNVYILVIVDQFTKWVEAIPLPDQTAEQVARAAVENFFVRMGCPMEIITDQGSNFESELFRELCKLLEISKKRTTPYHPSANGQVERLNRVILQMLRCVIQNRQDNWDEKLPYLLGAIRSTVNRSTGFTPNRLMLGREVHTPLTLMAGGDDRRVSTHAYNLFVEGEMSKCHQLARDHLEEQQRRQKRDRQPLQNTQYYEKGDIVLLINSASRIGICKKLQPQWQGPYLVTGVINPVLYEISSKNRKWIVHHDRLKKCLNRVLPLWLKRRRHHLLRNDPSEPVASVPRYCICNGIDDGRPMVACDGCDKWFHCECVNLSRQAAREMDDYFCADCRNI